MALALLGYGALALRFPSDHTPEGAYLRVAKAVSRGAPTEFFAYLEEPAQHACYTIGDYREKSRALAQKSFPRPEYEKFIAKQARLGDRSDGPEVFAWFAEEEGWLVQLRRDLSGIARVEVVGERATVQTARGTRYAFRRRPNGIWGMTAFTPLLLEEAERAARDHALVERAASDYARQPAVRAP